MLSFWSGAFTPEGRILSTFEANLETLPGASGNPETMNWSEKEVVVLGERLVTNGRTIEARIIDDPPNLEDRTVPAGESKAVLLYWEFGGSASEVLGPEITWDWRVRIGKAEHSLRVPMQRQQR